VYQGQNAEEVSVSEILLQIFTAAVQQWRQDVSKYSGLR
jgi:hypothetical protein